MKETHERVTPKPVEESFSVTPISASPNPTRKEYVKIEETLNAKEKYDPVFLNDFAPDDRYTRHHWIDALSLWFPVMLYKFAHGSQIGTLSFVWKIQQDANDADKTSHLVARLTRDQPKYSSRAIRKDFLDKYNRLSKTPIESMCCIIFINPW